MPKEAVKKKEELKIELPKEVFGDMPLQRTGKIVEWSTSKGELKLTPIPPVELTTEKRSREGEKIKEFLNSQPVRDRLEEVKKKKGQK